MADALFKYGEPLTIDYTPGADIAAGDVVVFGDVPIIAHVPITSGVKGAMATFGGVYDVVANEAIAVGKPVYWVDADDEVTETATGNVHFGYALTASAADGNVISVLHFPSGRIRGAAITSLTDSSGGTADDTIAAIGGTYSQAEVRNGFADLAAKVNAILARLRAAGIIDT